MRQRLTQRISAPQVPEVELEDGKAERAAKDITFQKKIERASRDYTRSDLDTVYRAPHA